MNGTINIAVTDGDVFLSPNGGAGQVSVTGREGS
jgi:hypothetical protein